METNIQDEENVNSIYTGDMPKAAEQDAETENQNDVEGTSTSGERKKYHSSAMYAASKWHNTVSRVQAHSNKGLDL